MHRVQCGWPALVGWRFLCVCAFDGFLLWFRIAYACPTTASLCNEPSVPGTVVLEYCACLGGWGIGKIWCELSKCSGNRHSVGSLPASCCWIHLHGCWWYVCWALCAAAWCQGVRGQEAMLLQTCRVLVDAMS